MPSRISIAVVDDHPIFREGVIRVLRSQPQFQIVGEGQSAEDAVKLAAALQPDVILLDVSMPGGGLEAARTIATTAPSTNIMMLTVVDDDSFVVAALEAGAKGYVLKGVSGPDLVKLIHMVRYGRSGAFFLSPGLASRILEQDAAQGRVGATTHIQSGLTDSDREILALMSDGQSHDQIAARTGQDVDQIQEKLSRILAYLRAVSQSATLPAPVSDKPVLH
ncbi:MAG: response regulator transcription factor [Devosia sp.]